MKFPLPYLKGIEIAYNAIRKKEKDDAKIAHESFLAINIKKYKRKTAHVDKTWDLINYHHELMFFKNDLLIDKLKEFGLKKSEIRWFLSLSDIEEQFQIIAVQRLRTFYNIMFGYPTSLIFKSIQDFS